MRGEDAAEQPLSASPIPPPASDCVRGAAGRASPPACRMAMRADDDAEVAGEDTGRGRAGPRPPSSSGFRSHAAVLPLHHPTPSTTVPVYVYRSGFVGVGCTSSLSAACEVCGWLIFTFFWPGRCIP